MTNPVHPPASGHKADYTLSVGLTAVTLFFVISGVVLYLNTRALLRDANSIIATHETLISLADVLSQLKDAESGQRGFIITGDEQYLETYAAATGLIQERMDRIEEKSQKNSMQLTRLGELKQLTQVKLDEMASTIELRRKQGFEAARQLVGKGRGKAAMDGIRARVDEMQKSERELRLKRMAEMDDAYWVAVASGIMSAVLGVFLTIIIGYLLRRAVRARQRQEWLQAAQVGLSLAMVGDQRLDQLGGSILRFLAEHLNAQAGALFARDGTLYRRIATHGVPVVNSMPQLVVVGDGLLGQAIKDTRTMLLHDVPDGYLNIGSALGQGKPSHLVIVPLVADGDANAVLELGFIQKLDDSLTEVFDRVSESVAVAIRSANYRQNLQNLLEETQRQAEELQVQSEELRVGNEELEEQSRALRESQNRLELQQAELEQTNSQLEEQTQLLEVQRDDLAKSQASLESQAKELAQASQYKSDFLANMSHELRTPLNSSLILAKLLADNPTHNLTDEQVKYAQTIQSAGNDLLALINDILDLAKIEAGRMEMRPEVVSLNQVIKGLSRTFEPLASQRGLQFSAQIAADCPDTLETDRQRLEQILKNLLSNAIKFTDTGAVTLRVCRAAHSGLAFEVHDTGIGIPAHQQKMVFEAFRQADGTTNRRHGGTGLGLSISRELTRLLCGEIELQSEVDRGSTFTVTIPEAYDPRQVQGASQSPPASLQSAIDAATKPVTLPKDLPEAKSTRSIPARRSDDDRERLSGSHNLILVVEDDESFARILYDLVQELDFQCLIAHTAEDALLAARQFELSAVVLDVGLPDHSGLSVLDRLKHNPRTRHIPVHVVSAGDYAETALALGAVGYMLKPVKRDELLQALQRLESHFARRMRRVLVVEDDPVQLDSLKKLLSSHEVQTVGAENAAACLECLKNETIDCMVLDLTLPDASGYSLLETLAQEDAYSFPPVIVYTGRDLSSDEEQRLRRYSKSIIIKGAKSPERLLDEVTLFLHQVVSELPPEQQRMLEQARSRDAALEGRRILIVEDDVRNVFALTSILENRGATVQITRNGRESLEALENSRGDPKLAIDLVLMDVMMPEMDGLTATREIRKQAQWKKLPIIMLTAKAMKDDQDRCLEAGANDYMSKPLDVEKLLSLVRVWMPPVKHGS